MLPVTRNLPVACNAGHTDSVAKVATANTVVGAGPTTSGVVHQGFSIPTGDFRLGRVVHVGRPLTNALKEAVSEERLDLTIARDECSQCDSGDQLLVEVVTLGNDARHIHSAQQ